MNPWAGLIIVIAILFFIIAWKGTQDNVLSAVLNRPYHGGSGSGATASTAAFASLPSTPSSTPPVPPLQGTTIIGGLPVGQA